MAAKTPEISPRRMEQCDEVPDVVFAKRGCCFWIPCLGSERSSSVWERIRTAEKEERWWTRGWSALKKIREWSEIVAGPRWKTFIRRLNRNRSNCCGGCGGGGVVSARHGKFHYDPLSYSLNFDEGPGQNGHFDENYANRDFSARFASIPASVKSSMDLGKDGPSFT